MSLSDEYSDDVREVTDDEVAFFEEHGWVMLKSLVSRRLVAAVLEEAKELVSEADQHIGELKKNGEDISLGYTASDYMIYWNPAFLTMKHIRRAAFLALSCHKGMGRAALRIVNRAKLTDNPVSIRLLEDDMFIKQGVGQSNNGETGYHQDWDFAQLDRLGSAAFWIALDEVTPEQGAMRFLDRSHRAGPLVPAMRRETETVLGTYPKLTEVYDWVSLHYEPGDVTVHHPFLVHGAPPNTTSKPRWGFVCTYAPDDCIPTESNRLGMPPPHDRFPMIYP